MARQDRDASVLTLIRDAFEHSRRRYGYRRIRIEPGGAGVIVSARRVMRLMTGNGIVAPSRSSRRYSSCKGEIAKAPENLVARDFHAVWPNELWGTDVTGTAIPAGKLHLSPVIDCYDGMPVSRTIATSPNAVPGNAAAEGFLGRLKQEFHHKRDFTGVTIDEFMASLDEYLVRYRDERIETGFGMGITAKRRELGLMA